jgi:hypothetical protein
MLAASYYKVGNNLTATLMLNNKGPQPVEVKPTLFSLTGERLEAAPVIVEGESFRNIDLRDFGALPGTSFQEGSLHLFHRGPDLVIGAQLYLVDEAHSLSFDEKLVEFQNAASTQLESVWWLPSRRASVSVILSNTGDMELASVVTLNAGTPHPETTNIVLLPHETRVVKVRRELPGNGPNLRDDVGSASITHTGTKGSLLARALIEDATSGYSLSAQFYSPQGGKSSGYQGVGLRLGKAGSEEIIPIVVARNVGDSPTTLSGRMPYTTIDGATGVVQFPSLRLRPGQASRIDVERAIRTQVHSQNIKTASVEFDYTTPPGSVMMAAQSVSENNNQVFRVPMWDVPAQRNGTGGYPWFIEGDSSTFVYIKNVTDKEQKYTFSLTYEGGVYATGLRSVKAGQTVAYDLRAMRDNQVPDERGRTIPLGATRGKIVWSVRGPDSMALLGRSEQADLTKGTSSSYACFMCCPNSFRRSRIEDYLGSIFGPINVPEGGFASVRGVEQDTTCYGSMTPEYYMGDTWFSSNSSIAPIDGFGDSADIEGLVEGTVTIQGRWEVYHYTSVYSYEFGTRYCEESSDMTEPDSPAEVKCAVPINFRLFRPPTNTGGVLNFVYTWDSSTGKKGDLSQCTVGEIVTYTGSDPYQPPTPPFPVHAPRNPTIRDLRATADGLEDIHSPGGSGTFVKPYVAASYTGVQTYRYSCPCKNNGAYVTLLGPHNIVRTVSQNPDNTWKYVITKLGQTATIDPLP